MKASGSKSPSMENQPLKPSYGSMTVVDSYSILWITDPRNGCFQHFEEHYRFRGRGFSFTKQKNLDFERKRFLTLQFELPIVPCLRLVDGCPLLKPYFYSVFVCFVLFPISHFHQVKRKVDF